MKLKQIKCDCKNCSIINFCGELRKDSKICKNKKLKELEDFDYIFFAIDCNRRGIKNNLEIEELAVDFFSYND